MNLITNFVLAVFTLLLAGCSNSATVEYECKQGHLHKETVENYKLYNGYRIGSQIDCFSKD
jgi:outer membrane biogenesis lipoprotein LolB